jgi:hypothetical protein
VEVSVVGRKLPHFNCDILKGYIHATKNLLEGMLSGNLSEEERNNIQNDIDDYLKLPKEFLENPGYDVLIYQDLDYPMEPSMTRGSIILCDITQDPPREMRMNYDDDALARETKEKELRKWAIAQDLVYNEELYTYYRADDEYIRDGYELINPGEDAYGLYLIWSTLYSNRNNLKGDNNERSLD